MALGSPSRLSGLLLAKAVLERMINQDEAAGMLDRVDLRDFFDEVVRYLAAERADAAESAIPPPHDARLNGGGSRTRTTAGRDSSAELAALWQDCGEGD
jgi:hypothetical protein